MKYIEEIKLKFADYEYMIVPRNVIGRFDIEDIQTHIHRIGIARNDIAKCQVPNKIALEIFAEYNAEHAVRQPFSRITLCNDITSIEVVYEDGSRDIFYTDCDGEDSNTNQKSIISTLGNLYVVIGKDIVIGDVFTDDYMNNAVNVKLRKKTLHIGIKEELPHPFAKDSLPELYRYVYLSNGERDCLAMRVEDPECGWRFVYDKPDHVIHFPTQWVYAESNIVAYFDKHNIERGFTTEQIKKKYPPQNAD